MKARNKDVPNYVMDLVDLIDSGDLVLGPLTGVLVAHDDDCSHWEGRPCDCDPDLVIQEIA